MRAFREEEWRRVREGGKRAFLLRYGVLGRGLPFGILLAVGIELYRGAEFPAALTDARFLGTALFSVAVLSLSGCIGASANWALHERRYASKP